VSVSTFWPKAGLFLSAWRQTGFRLAGHIVFRKAYASKTGFLQYRHEQAYLLAKGNPPRPAEPPPDVMDWTYTGNTLHPTQKPVELMRRPILNHTVKGEAVYDGFLGSGSTLIAAELTERICYGLEIDPRYVDVICQRWMAITGRQATLESDGRTFAEIQAERVVVAA